MVSMASDNHTPYKAPILGRHADRPFLKSQPLVYTCPPPPFRPPQLVPALMRDPARSDLRDAR